MYKSKYTPTLGLPLTFTIPMLLEWKGISPRRIEEQTNGAIKQAHIHRICAAETRNPGKPVIDGLADFFGVSFAEMYDVEAITRIVSGDIDSQIHKELTNYHTQDSALKALQSALPHMSTQSVHDILKSCISALEDRQDDPPSAQ